MSAKRALNKVGVGHTTVKQFSDLLEKSGLPELNCRTQGNCEFSFTAQNHGLSMLRLAPLTSIGMQVEFRNNVARRAYLIGMIGESGQIGFVEADQLDLVGTPCGGHACIDRSAKGGTAIKISMDREVEESKRNAAFDVNSGCLSKIGGCKSSKELLPNVP